MECFRSLDRKGCGIFLKGGFSRQFLPLNTAVGGAIPHEGVSGAAVYYHFLSGGRLKCLSFFVFMGFDGFGQFKQQLKGTRPHLII